MTLFNSRPTETTVLSPIVDDQYFIGRTAVNSVEIELTNLSEFEFSVSGANWPLLQATNQIPFHIENLGTSRNMNMMFWISHWENGTPIGEIVMLTNLNSKFTFTHIPNGKIWLNMWYFGNTNGQWFGGSLVETIL